MNQSANLLQLSRGRSVWLYTRARVIVELSAIATIVFCVLQTGQMAEGFELLFLLPLSFAVMFPLASHFLSESIKGKLTVSLIIAYSWVRVVFIPMVGAISGYYNEYGVLGTALSTSKAIILMSVECTATLFLALLFSKLQCKKEHVACPYRLTLAGSKMVYILFAVFAVGVFVFVGRKLSLFQFAFINVRANTRFVDITDYKSVAVRFFITTGFTFFMLLVISEMYMRYGRTTRIRYFYMALVIVVLRLLLIEGQRRSNQVYIGFSVMLLMTRLFPTLRKQITLGVVTAAGVVLVSMSIYKFFGAYLFGSYSAAIARANVDEKWLASTLDAYFLGVSSVSNNIQYALGLSSRPDMGDFLQNIGRNIFGVHYLFKSNTLTAVQQYNLLIYGGVQDHGHLMSSIGLGFLYGGPIVAVPFSLLNIVALMGIREALNSAKSMEYYYALSLVYIRIGFSLFSDSFALINYSSQILILYSLVILVAVSAKKILGEKKVTGQ